MAIITQFPVHVDLDAPAAILSARVAVGVNRATETMCANLVSIDHADERAKAVTMLMLLEVIGRAASDPDTTVNQLLQALWEQVPEDTRMAAEGGRR
jgi:hypothetical protein